MAYKASELSPTARLVLVFLSSQQAAQSAIEISDGVGGSYWNTRTLCQKMVQSGHLQQTMIGTSPHYSIPQESTDPSSVEGGVG
jgi:hypothetical protein